MAIRQIFRVVLWMTGALLAFSAMAVSVRALGSTLTVMEIIALRAGLGLAVMAAIAGTHPQLRATINRRHWGLHLIRNTVHLGAQYLWTWSLLLLPLATVFALEFTTPAWALVLALPVLGERMTASRIGAVVLGLFGVLVILRPGLEAFHPAALLVLAAAVGLATTLITTKRLTRTDSSFAIIFWMNLIQAPVSFVASQPLFFLKLAPWQLPSVAAIGGAGLISHYCLANAFRAGDASVVVPLDFMRIPLIAVIAWWLYGERLDVFVFIGAALIIVGILWNLRAEAARPNPAVAGSDREPMR